MSEQERNAAPEREWRDRENHRGYLVVAVILGLSVLLGVMVFWRYVGSQRQLADAYYEIEARGAELTTEGCVDEVLHWREDCGAMKGLCDMTVNSMMDACLSAGDRSAYCAEHVQDMGTTHFGYEECEARDLDREGRNVCSSAYRVIDHHCRALTLEPNS